MGNMVSSSPLYDRELQRFLDDDSELERKSLTPEGILSLRETAVSVELESLLRGSQRQGLQWSTVARDGHILECTTLSPPPSKESRAALFHIHSGGMVAGHRLIGMDLMARWVDKFDIVCSAADYRLAPEHPFPTPLNDCFDALCAFAATVKPGIPLIVAGMSAGGGLAAGLSLMAQDSGGPQLAGSLLMCPMLDSSNSSASSLQFQNLGLWDRQSNDTGWDAYLGPARQSAIASPYASPASATELRGLPPTFLDVGTQEVFRSEILSYAERLACAEVPVELHMWAGAFHGFDRIYPSALVSQNAISAREKWLERLLGGNLS